MSDSASASAPAKLNLFLRILAREASGYHGLETLFCQIDLADELTAEVTERPGVSLSVVGAETGPPEKNLAVLAAEMVLKATGNPFGVALTLTKRVPVKAGLGGGSSDAAAALRAVNQLAGHSVPTHELLQYAARLGSDVPFFLSGARLALGWGHGERLLRLPALPQRAGLLVVPEDPVATADAYRWIDEAGVPGRGAVAMTADTLADWSDIARLAGNDFEGPVFSHHPPIRAAFEGLAATAPLMCRLSGSGSALFALYRTPSDRDTARGMMSRKLGHLIDFETVG